MNVRINHHSTELTATRWTPTGGKVGHDIILTDRELIAVHQAARMMVGHAVARIGTTPVTDALAMLRKAVA
jgi:hypothetical protein